MDVGQVGSTFGPGGSSASSIFGGIAPRHNVSSSFVDCSPCADTIVPLMVPGMCMPVAVDEEAPVVASLRSAGVT